MVEAQHFVSTLKVVDSLAEQALLETLLEDTKPAIPPECRHLHYLLATPFRYGSLYPSGSRFRRAGHTLGVYYASEAPQTAAAEIAFYRLLFFSESPDTPWPIESGRVHGVLGRLRGEVRRSHAHAPVARQRHMDAPDGLHAVPGLGRHGPRRRGKDDPLRVRARSGRGRERRASRLHCFHGADASRTSDVAVAAESARRAGHPRISGAPHRVPARSVRRRPEASGSALSPPWRRSARRGRGRR